MTKQEIQKEIAELKEEMKNVHGTPCTVWSRVVGYLRPVHGWNKGKIEEYKARKFYNVADGNEANKEANEAHYNLMSTRQIHTLLHRYDELKEEFSLRKNMDI